MPLQNSSKDRSSSTHADCAGAMAGILQISRTSKQTSKQQHTRTPWYSWLPWEKLKRATFMPERSISHSVGTLRGGAGLGAGRGSSCAVGRAKAGGLSSTRHARVAPAHPETMRNEERGSKHGSKHGSSTSQPRQQRPALLASKASRSNSRLTRGRRGPGCRQSATRGGAHGQRR